MLDLDDPFGNAMRPVSLLLIDRTGLLVVVVVPNKIPSVVPGKIGSNNGVCIRGKVKSLPVGAVMFVSGISLCL